MRPNKRAGRLAAIGLAGFALGVGGIVVAQGDNTQPIEQQPSIDDLGVVSYDEVVSAAERMGYGDETNPVMSFVRDCLRAGGFDVEQDADGGITTSASSEAIGGCFSDLRALAAAG